jgi:hypothetical protein
LQPDCVRAFIVTLLRAGVVFAVVSSAAITLALLLSRSSPGGVVLAVFAGGLNLLFAVRAVLGGICYLRNDLPFQARVNSVEQLLELAGVGVAFATRWASPLLPLSIYAVCQTFVSLAYGSRARALYRAAPESTGRRVPLRILLRYLRDACASRAFEVGVFWAVPLCVFHVRGAVAAAQFRVAMSVNRIITKLVPLRPEYLQSDVAEDEFSPSRAAILVSILAVLGGAALYLGYHLVPGPAAILKLGPYAGLLLAAGAYTGITLLNPLLLVRGRAEFAGLASVIGIVVLLTSIALFWKYDVALAVGGMAVYLVVLLSRLPRRPIPRPDRLALLDQLSGQQDAP